MILLGHLSILVFLGGFILVFEDVILNTSIHRKMDIRIVDDKKDLHLLEG